MTELEIWDLDMTGRAAGRFGRKIATVRDAQRWFAHVCTTILGDLCDAVDFPFPAPDWTHLRYSLLRKVALRVADGYTRSMILQAAEDFYNPDLVSIEVRRRLGEEGRRMPGLLLRFLGRQYDDDDRLLPTVAFDFLGNGRYWYQECLSADDQSECDEQDRRRYEEAWHLARTLATDPGVQRMKEQFLRKRGTYTDIRQGSIAEKKRNES